MNNDLHFIWTYSLLLFIVNFDECQLGYCQAIIQLGSFCKLDNRKIMNHLMNIWISVSQIDAYTVLKTGSMKTCIYS